jgi:hypothetical protein
MKLNGIAEGKVFYDMSGQSLPAAAGGDTGSLWRGRQKFRARRGRSYRRLRRFVNQKSWIIPNT